MFQVTFDFDLAATFGTCRTETSSHEQSNVGSTRRILSTGETKKALWGDAAQVRWRGKYLPNLPSTELPCHRLGPGVMPNAK